MVFDRSFPDTKKKTETFRRYTVVYTYYWSDEERKKKYMKTQETVDLVISDEKPSLKAKVWQKVYRLRYAAGGIMGTVMSLLHSTGVFAAAKAAKAAKATATPAAGNTNETATNYNFINQSPEDGGIFSGLISTIKNMGQSAYQLFITLSVIATVAGVFVVVVGFNIHKNPQKKAEDKEHLGSVLMGIGLIFAVPGIIAILAGIGAAFK